LHKQPDHFADMVAKGKRGQDAGCMYDLASGVVAVLTELIGIPAMQQKRPLLIERPFDQLSSPVLEAVGNI